MKKIIYFISVLFLISSCSKQVLEIGQTDIQPYYVTVKQLISLENGMSKKAVATLGLIIFWTSRRNGSMSLF